MFSVFETLKNFSQDSPTWWSGWSLFYQYVIWWFWCGKSFADPNSCTKFCSPICITIGSHFPDVQISAHSNEKIEWGCFWFPFLLICREPGFINLDRLLLSVFLNQTEIYLPYARHHRPLSIWSRSRLKAADFRLKKWRISVFST